MRVKYSDDPRKFIESEADLDFELKGLVVLTTNPGLFYPELVKVGSVNSLIGLLSHENADIASATIELIEELTDDDVLDAGENLEDEEEEREDGQVERNGQEGMRLFVDSLAENQILELLVSNLQRFKDEPVSEANGAAAEGRAQEEEETDAQAIFHTLGALENLVSFKPSLAESLVQETEFLKWTLERVKRKGGYDQNKGYAGEMLAIVLSSSEKNRRRVGQVGGIDVLLGVLAQYRKRDPIDADETEFMENIFDALCSCLSLDENKALFFEGEGVELMVIIMKEKRMSRLRSIKVLNHALSGPGGSKNCVKFIESLGLKTLFSAFMGKGSTANGSKAKKRKKAEAASTTTLEDEEHILGIIVSLLNNLESESAERIRLLSKFVEEEYEKVDRLLEVRENLVSRIQSVETGIEKEKKELEEEGIEIGDEEQEVFYLRRLENGLFSLQLVDYITAWICMEDDGVRAHVKMLLERKGSGLEDVIQVLKEYHDNMGDESVAIGSEREERGEKQTEVKTKDIIVALVNFLLAS
ncbi:hypothetical protein IE53DRAFT_388314 [Violaceomyces palustris]|uniref:Uncharacterized protein n=1 Tax=Violaceomyces palustris TaxID=1673888 RepID=A0ACD0NUL1_9BASI|nr:hypothetical protein IE53DRAFT_388314 [Violaceomyces palustris]